MKGKKHITKHLTIKNKNILSLSILLIICILSSCVNIGSDVMQTDPSILSSNRWGEVDAGKTVEDRIVNVNFTVGEKIEKNMSVKESLNEAKKIGREHNVKYYSYQPSEVDVTGDFSYYDVFGQKHVMNIRSKCRKTKT